MTVSKWGTSLTATGHPPRWTLGCLALWTSPARRYHNVRMSRSMVRMRCLGLAVAILTFVLAPFGQPVSASGLPARGGIPLSGIAKLICLSSQRCIAAGLVNPLTGGIALTTNAGTTWSLVAQDPVSELSGTALTDLACDSPICVAVGHQPDRVTGPRGLILVSHDGGSTWTQANSGASELFGVSCSSPVVCSAVGFSVYGGANGQMAVHTTDGGRTWVGASLPSDITQLVYVACTDHDVCLAAGHVQDALTAVLRSTTGGQSWTHQSTYVEPLAAISNLDCSTEGSCVIAGAVSPPTSTVVWSNNAGGTWNTAHVPSKIFDISDVACASRSRCVAIAEQVIRRKLVGLPFYTDGLRRWTVGSVSPSTASMSAVSCITITKCFAAAEEPSVGGILLQTNDGGKQWTN